MTALLLVVAGVVLVGYVVVAYNRFVSQRTATAGAWHNVDVELARRHDLVPNLVATVSGAAAFERSTLEAVVAARAAAVAAQGRTPAAREAPEADLAGALSRLLALAESYPALTATASFEDLQVELGNTEDRIAAARRFYNQSVRDYNTRLATVPSMWVGRATRFAPADFFAAEDSARSPVGVRFEP